MAQTHAKATYLREEDGRFIFEKRWNPDRGDLPFLKGPKIMKAIQAGERTEAILIARRWANDLKFLQAIAKREENGVLLTRRSELDQAARAWLLFAKAGDWFVHDILEAEARHGAHTKSAKSGDMALADIRATISDRFRESDDPTDEIGHESLTPLGAALYRVLSGAIPLPNFSESIHLYESNKRLRDARPSEAGFRKNRQWLEQFVQLVGDKPFDQIKRTDVERYIAARGNAGLKSSTIRRELVSLGSMWNQMSRKYECEKKSPFSSPDIPTAHEPEAASRAPKQGELKRLYGVLRRTQGKYVPLIAVLVLTGMRLGEAWGLERQDWDVTSGELNVRPNSLRPLKNAGSQRRIPVTQTLASWLELLFQGDRGASPTSASNMIKRTLESEGFAFGAHGCRHGMRDLLVSNSVPEYDINRLLGWTSQKSMVNHYGGNESLAPLRRHLEKVHSGLADEAA